MSALISSFSSGGRWEQMKSQGSAPILADLALLQDLQATWRFVMALVPPLEKGTLWSSSNLSLESQKMQ